MAFLLEHWKGKLKKTNWRKFSCSIYPRPNCKRTNRRIVSCSRHPRQKCKRTSWRTVSCSRYPRPNCKGLTEYLDQEYLPGPDIQGQIWNCKGLTEEQFYIPHIQGQIVKELTEGLMKALTFLFIFFMIKYLHVIVKDSFLFQISKAKI